MPVNTPTSTTTYSGKVAAGYVSKALLSGDTLEGEHITIRPGIKGKEKVQDITVGSMLQEDSELFSPTGTTTISERVLEPVALKVNRQESKTKLESSYEGERMLAGANNSDFPTDLNAYYIDLMTGVTAEEMELLIWQGDKKSANNSQLRFFDGFVTLACKDAAVIDVPSPSAVTATNAIAKIRAAYNLIPKAIRRRKDFTIYVSDDVAEAYTDALADKGNDKTVDEERPLTYKGKKMVSLAGLPDNTIICTRKANLLFGTDLKDDFNQVKVLDLSETTGDDVLRYKMRAKAGVQYVYGNQIVMHTTFVPIP